jgi:hypothetical protein
VVVKLLLLYVNLSVVVGCPYTHGIRTPKPKDDLKAPIQVPVTQLGERKLIFLYNLLGA